MPEQTHSPRPGADPYEPPSRRRLAQGTAVAAAAAFVVLVAFVLPAEYGADPLGTGGLLGLDGLADEGVVPPAEASLEPLQEAGFRTDSVAFVLRPGDGIEYKLRLDAGQTLHYEWATDNDRRVFYDMHGDGRDAPEADGTSHKSGTGSSDGGSFEVPFDGRHGWYWSNPGPEPVEITVRFSGFYEKVGFV